VELRVYLWNVDGDYPTFPIGVNIDMDAASISGQFGLGETIVLDASVSAIPEPLSAGFITAGGLLLGLRRVRL
jgi:hypothetical protein